MKYFKNIIVIIMIIILSGCNSNNSEVNDKFYLDYYKYNDVDGYIKVELDNSKVYKYSNNSDIKKIFNGNGIIFVGDSKDNKSRLVVNTIDKVINNTDVSDIYYLNDINGVKDYIEGNIDIPIVIFVVNGKVDSYYVNDKDKLSDDEQLELYNKYLDGVHKVLGDVCDEEC